MESVKQKLNIEDSVIVDSVGKAGGLALFWKHWIKMIEVELSNFYIAARMTDIEARCEWTFIGIYASTDDGRRRSQWREIERTMTKWGDKWIIVGDFNDILSNGEKWGGRQRPEWSFADFRGLVTGNELVDIEYEGKPWTWCSHWEGQEIKQRLDRALGNKEWTKQFETAKCIHIEKEASDHSLIMLDTMPRRRKGGRRFHFDKKWAQSQHIQDLISREWEKPQQGSKMFSLTRKVNSCKMRLIEWSKANETNFGKEIKCLKQQIMEAKAGDYGKNKRAHS